MHFANWRLFYEENRKMLLVPEKSSLNREFRKMEIRLYCILSLSSLYLRHWVDCNTLKKLKVARALEKSAQPCYKFRALDSKPEGLGSIPPNTLRVHTGGVQPR
ncbi:hypothetical protein TNCV_3995181 [Trichonephila clavipes]|nr:hypothetical protein TNCV_3995181 [Trichonephila clavipes]